MDAQFYQKLSPEEAYPYLSVILGQQEIFLEKDVDGYGTIKAHDKTAGIIWEARNRFSPFVFDGKKLYHEPFWTCDINVSLRLLAHFFEGERPRYAAAWFGYFNGCQATDPNHPQTFIIGRPNEADAVMFAFVPRDAMHPLTILKDYQEDPLWRSGSLQNLGPLIKGDVVDYYIFRMPTSIAWQSELQEQAHFQAERVHSAFQEWEERMKRVDTRYQEIMELEFVFDQFGFYHSERDSPTKLHFMRRGGARLNFDLEVDTKDTVLKALHQWQTECNT